MKCYFACGIAVYHLPVIMDVCNQIMVMHHLPWLLHHSLGLLHIQCDSAIAQSIFWLDKWSNHVCICITELIFMIDGLGKNIERHTAHTIVSWPNPKQWVIVHTFDLMMIIRQSIYIISIITRGVGKLKTSRTDFEHHVVSEMCNGI